MAESREKGFTHHAIVVALSLFLLLSFAGYSLILISDTNKLLEANAKQNAEELTFILKEFRELYSTEVVNRVLPLGVEVTHDYQTRENSIPLPATLTVELAKRIGAHGHGETIRLYSEYPFPWSVNGGVKDSFELQGIEALKNNPDEPFGRIESLNGVETYRYATADVMGKGCVNCHNSHPQSPKRDWKVGDVRGVLEVNFPTVQLVVDANEKVQQDIIITFLIATVSLVLLMLFVLRQGREKGKLEIDMQFNASELISRERQLSAVLDNVIDGIITISERGVIESFNPAANKIFGYSNEEVVGQNVKMLMPEPYHSEHDGYLDHHINTGEKKVIGIGREVTGKRKDGSTFPMDLAVSEVIIDDVRHFVGITRDITQRKHVEQMQKEFVSTVSHELRTPLTSIRGSLGLILGGVTGELPEKAKSLLTIANNNSERLINLINDILDMEKVTAGKMQFDYTVVDLVSVVQLAVESNKGFGDQLHVSFELITAPDDAVMVRIDEKRTAQVMSNLLSNAAKYSPIDDSVKISVTTSEKSVRISVHDNGKGIPEEFKSKIFGKFSQADSSDTRQKGGTGLGLSITKAIVEQQGGSIGFDSEAGEGTTFYVDLPLWEAIKRRQEERRNEERRVESRDVEEEQRQSERRVEERRLAQSSLTLDSDKPLVLVVEDDKDVSKLICILLQKEGYQFHQAFSYQEAVQMIQTHQYSAITLDLMIPGGSGLSLLRELRDNKVTEELPVIVVSAKANEGKIEAKAFSMVDWLEKPIDEKKLMGSIRVSLSHLEARSARILHVEDDHDLASIIDSVLPKEFPVINTTTLEQTKQLLKNERFDLVLLDIGLPDGSGLELLPIFNSQEHQTPRHYLLSSGCRPRNCCTGEGCSCQIKD